MRRSRLNRLLGTVAAAAALSGCALTTSLPESSGLTQRLAAFPVSGLPLEAPVTVHWTDHQIPFIEAGSDRDLAFTLGLVHAHLRLGQMEVLRRISQGRISEMGGPPAAEIDHSLRILNFGRAAPEIVASMPPETRTWMDGFVAGINHYLMNVRELPHEFTLLGLEREPWQPTDIVTIGRLASTDINWLIWFRLMPLRDRPDWPVLWRRLIEEGSSSLPSYVSSAPDNPLADLLASTGRSGSNSISVAASRSGTGGALMANDPHLGLSLPNLWLLAGYKSPSHHAVGLMIPGVPFVAVGRNPWIAWGGTNLRSANSDLFDISGLPPEAIRVRQETVDVRWWFDREVTVRETDYGPVVSDAPLLPVQDGETLALSWIGHRPSDEVTAMLGVNRAQGWDEFRSALAGFAVAPQNLLYADVEGNIGQVMATRLPARPLDLPDDIVRPLDEAVAWERIVTSDQLPYSFSPPSGFLASANNRPTEADVLVGYFFSANDRIRRMTELLGENGAITVEDLATLQLDVFQASAVGLRDILVTRLSGLPLSQRLRPGQQRVADLMATWDGNYRAESAGAAAFELTAYHFANAFLEDTQLAAYEAAGRVFSLLTTDVAEASDYLLSPALDRALSEAGAGLAEFPTWGDMHRIGLAHTLSNIPVIGDRYRFGDHPADGSNATIMKTAGRLSGERHLARFGANARHISDLSDLDENYFVLLGGQDGWFNSSTFLDQWELWQRGEYIRLPLRLETVRATFRHRMELTP